MSFLSSQRGYDALSPPDLDLPRVSMNTLPPFDSISSSSLQSVLHPSMSHSSPSNPPVADRPQISLPKVGQTRCYWALLSSELNFLYLDPVLANHLKEQADLLLGKSLLTFVHPDEQASAEQDLGGVLESRTLHGSVTRVRYSRLSRVRRQLGYQGPTDEWADAKKIAVDGQYMAVDLVINWAADGLVLCFMHAAVDLSTRDNDPVNKTDWTNWCGTPYMSGDQVDFLHEQLNKRVTVPPTHDRVFQILLDQPERPLWVSWPPDTSDNSGPTAKDFARLAEDIQIGPLSSSGTDAKTNCTRRYKALQTLPFGVNSTREVESIFIPYGSIIFACHRVNTYAKSGVSAIIPQHIHTNNHYPPMNQQYYDHSYSHPSTHHSYNNGYPPPMPHPSAPYSSHNWPPGSEPGPHPQYNNQWVSQNAPISSSPSVSSMRSASYPPPHQHQWSSQPPYMDSNPQTSYSFPPPNVSYPGSAQVPPSPGPPSPGSDVVPASRIPRRGTGNRDSYTNGGRTSGNPPNGVNRCASCKVTHSPEWRKGPSGKKDLCNACGLRYARSRAKKEGSAQRRRKERVLNTMSSRDDHSPSGSPVSMPYSGMRGRSSTYDDGSFVSNSSAGSASGNEAFPHHHHHGMGMTPSPSPPGNGFIPYSHQSASHNQPHNQYSSHGEHRSHYNNHPAAFYSVPPPPPGHGMHHHMSNSHSSGHSRMDSNVPLGRVSPLVSPSSPVCSSPLSTGLSAASFEREKQRERENERGLLPPTPDSTEHPCSSKLKY